MIPLSHGARVGSRSPHGHAPKRSPHAPEYATRAMLGLTWSEVNAPEGARRRVALDDPHRVCRRGVVDQPSASPSPF